MKKLTDRPGRYFAIFIFAPTLLYCGITVRPHYSSISNVLILLSILLFVYEMFWICCKENQTFDVIYINENSET